MDVKEGLPCYINLYQLNGLKVTNLKQVPKDAKILIATETEEYVGVEFRDYRL